MSRETANARIVPGHLWQSKDWSITIEIVSDEGEMVLVDMIKRREDGLLQNGIRLKLDKQYLLQWYEYISEDDTLEPRYL